MKMRRIIMAMVWLLPIAGFSAPVKQPLYGQVLFGSLKLDDNTVRFTANDEVFEGELPSSIPYLGAAAQVIIKDDFLGYGWEGGGFFSWKNDSVSYYGSSDSNGTSIRISVDNSFWSFETFFGLYASLKPIDRLRFYAGAGPLFLFATSKVDKVEEPPVPTPYSGSSIVIDTNRYHSDFTVGAYARAGFDVYLQDNFWLGFSARHMWADLDFSKTIGTFDIDGDIYFLTLTKKLY